MSHRARVVFSVAAFVAVLVFVTSDSFEYLRDAIPEFFYYYMMVFTLAITSVVGVYSWWQNSHGRPIEPAVVRFKKHLGTLFGWSWWH
jgi:hypothetical protein